MRKILKKIGLNPFVMTTGSRGVHVVAPIIRKHEFSIVRDYAKRIAQYLVDMDPDNLTVEIRKEKRGKKIRSTRRKTRERKNTHQAND